MSTKNIIGISLSFVGLLVGAGFATGQEVVQYFTSFGGWAIPGIIVAAIVMTLAGTVFLQLGSYFHAREHNQVFRSIAHPVVSKLLDIAVILTLFCIGFVMLAGAGSNLEQQFGWPAWIGSLAMLILVMLAGMLDVDKVSKVIGYLTPTIIIAVIFAAIYTAFNMPDDVSATMEASAQLDSPIGHWLVSAVNYNGLALMLAVSMTLVIGGDNISPREAGWGGIVGGIIYAIMMALAGFALLMNAETVGDSDIPMLEMFNDISPVLGYIMVVVIFLMIFNTAIGMFYALGKRLSSGHEGRYKVIFLTACVLGFGVSFVGFTTLMEYVYPVLGYMGMAMVAILVFAWVRSTSQIQDEAKRRERIRSLMTLKLHPEMRYDEDRYDDELGQHIADSNMEDEELYEDLSSEVATKLDKDDDVDFSKEKHDKDHNDASYYTERDNVKKDRSQEESHEWMEENDVTGDPEKDDEDADGSKDAADKK